jgi:fibronectin type 3 domain-containing protein
MEVNRVNLVRWWISFIVLLLLNSTVLTGCGTSSSSTPMAPSGVTATPGESQATIAWTAVPDATSYNIYWSTTSGVTPANGTAITGATNPYNLTTGLTDGTTYYFVVTAVNSNNSGGESAASSQVSCTPGPVPTGVVVTPGDGQATIVWTPVTGATSYNIYWSTATGVTSAKGTKITGAVSPYTLTGLTDGTKYYFVVTAVNSTSETGPSTQISATPSTASPPAAPTGVTATFGDTQAIIAWTAVKGATSYNIYWSKTTGVNSSTGTAISSPTNPYTMTGLTDGTTYYFVVTAVNGNGESAISTQVSCTPGPEVPTGVTATTGDGQVTISWTNIANAASYNIYWSLYPGVTAATGYFISGATNPYTLTGLTDGTTYYFVVTDVNSDSSESSVSSEVSAVPAKP